MEKHLVLRRVAALDAGTNAVRCLVAEVIDNRCFRPLENLRFPVRLGEGLSANGSIGPRAEERFYRALFLLRHIVDPFNIDRWAAVGTSALRTAENGARIIEAVRRRFELPLRAIDGLEEAALSFLSAVRMLPIGTAAVTLDVGGGSTEVAWGRGGKMETAVSLSLGAVTLTERYLRSNPPSPGEIAALRNAIATTLRDTVELTGARRKGAQLVCSGGTITTIADWLDAARPRRPSSPAHREISRRDLETAFDRLRTRTRDGRIRLGIPQERADIIVAGLAVIVETLTFLGTPATLVNRGGVREGLIYQMIDSAGPRRRSDVRC